MENLVRDYHLSQDDISLLRELKPFMERHVDDFLENFYSYLDSLED